MNEQKFLAISRYAIAFIFILLAVFITPKLAAGMISRALSYGDILLIILFRICLIILAVLVILSKLIMDKCFPFYKKYPIEKKVLIVLLGIILVIGILHVLTYFISAKIFAYNFNLDKEWNFTTWFSSALLLTVGLLALTNAILSKDLMKKFFWSAFSAIFVFLSLDDMIQIHESLSRRFHVGAWFLIGAPAAIIIFAIVLYIAIKANIDKKIWKTILLGIVILLIGQVGMESIGNYFLTFNSFPYHMEVLIEETLGKTVAISILIYALIKNIRIHSKIINEKTD